MTTTQKKRRGPAPTFSHDQAITLRRDGHTYTEIGRILGVKPHTIQVALARSRALQRAIPEPVIEAPEPPEEPTKNVDVFCRCDRCNTAARVETGNEIPRHWETRHTREHGRRDLCPGCVRGIAINEPERPPVTHGTPRPSRRQLVVPTRTRP